METTWETFQAAYQAATPELKAFIDSEHIGLFLDGQLAKEGIDVLLKPKLIIALSDFALGITTTNELGSALLALGIPFESSHRLYTEIIKFISDAKAGQLPVTTNPVSQSQSNPLETEIAETEKTLEKMQGIRTMAQDIKEAEAHMPSAGEAVYQSSQTDILRPGAQAAAHAPRWETDN